MNKQWGGTFIGMIFIIVMVVCIGVLVVKVAPVYMENYSVRKSIEVMDRLSDGTFSDDKSSNAQAIKERLINQFSINGLYKIDTKNLEVVPGDKDNTYVITMDYQVIKPLLYNVSLLFVFHESQEIRIAKGE